VLGVDLLGVDWDSELVAPEFDERNPAVLAMIGAIIDGARRAGWKVGICGHAPSDYPETSDLGPGEGGDLIGGTR
jgi:pyruvate, water dikinase